MSRSRPSSRACAHLVLLRKQEHRAAASPHSDRETNGNWDL